MRKKSPGKIVANTPSVIAEGTHVLGEIKFFGALVIEGEITGNILSQEGGEPSLTVLDKGLVRGEIRAPSVLVCGRVIGDIYADKLIELAAGAVVEGNVHYNVLEVAKGAQVNGSLVQGTESRSEKVLTPVDYKTDPQERSFESGIDPKIDSKPDNDGFELSEKPT